jgi:hypothetical protein
VEVVTPHLKQDAPLRYRLGWAVSRSALPRERFRSLARSGHSVTAA